MLEVIKIDSLQIRIPKYKVQYIDPTFAKEFIKVYHSEDDNDMTLTDGVINLDKHKVSVVDGIKTRIAEMHVMTGHGVSEKQIIIQLNAKKLKERYLEGLVWNTIKVAYNYLMDLKIVYFEYEDFLKGQVGDIDFCYDVSVNPIILKQGNKEIYNNIKISCKRFVESPISSSKGATLYLNTRKNATPTRPHIKIYHKTLELLYNEDGSVDFAKKFLKNVNFEDIGRFEYTIKNRAHRKRLKLDCITLEDYLNLSQNTLGSIIFSDVFLYIDKSNLNKALEELRGKDKMLYAFIERCRSHGDDLEDIYSILDIYPTPVKKSRAKKQLDVLLFRITKALKVSPDYETSKFLEAIRINFWGPGTEL